MGEEASRGGNGAGQVQGEPLTALSFSTDSHRSMNQHVAVLVALALPLLTAWPTDSVLLKIVCVYLCMHRRQAGERVKVADGAEFFTVLGQWLARIVDGSWARAGSRLIAPAALSNALFVFCTHLCTAMSIRYSFPASYSRRRNLDPLTGRCEQTRLSGWPPKDANQLLRLQPIRAALVDHTCWEDQLKCRF